MVLVCHRHRFWCFIVKVDKQVGYNISPQGHYFEIGCKEGHSNWLQAMDVLDLWYGYFAEARSGHGFLFLVVKTKFHAICYARI